MPSSASVCAEPRCAKITTLPRSLRATCTATAPEAVRTFRTYATARTYRFSTPKHPTARGKLQVKGLSTAETGQGVQTQVAALRTARDRAMILAMLLGGLRRCKVLGLELADIALADRRVTITEGKGGPRSPTKFGQ